MRVRASVRAKVRVCTRLVLAAEDSNGRTRRQLAEQCHQRRHHRRRHEPVCHRLPQTAGRADHGPGASRGVDECLDARSPVAKRGASLDERVDDPPLSPRLVQPRVLMGLACTDVTVRVAAEDGRAREPAPTVDYEGRRRVHALAAIEQREQREEELAEPQLRGCARWSKVGEGRCFGEVAVQLAKMRTATTWRVRFYPLSVWPETEGRPLEPPLRTPRTRTRSSALAKPADSSKIPSAWRPWSSSP